MHGGATTTGPDMTPPPSYLSKLGGGGLGEQFGGGRLEEGGRVGHGGGGFPRWGGLRTTHYYHMHTSRGDVCLGVWGYGGMYVKIALSRLCWEESLKGQKGSMHKKTSAPLAPWPQHHCLSKPGGVSHTRTRPGRPPLVYCLPCEGV